MLKVCKFGGSSVADAAQFTKVKNIITSDPSRCVAVISAAGKRTKDDYKMTDLLYLTQAHLKYGVSAADILGKIRDRFTEIRDALGLGLDIGAEFDKYAAGLSKDTEVDELVSRGEYFTSRLMAEYLGYTFIDAKDCIFFDYNGSINLEKSYKAIEEAVKLNGKIVLPGFYGSLPNGKIKVMSRGGSDITGSIAAAAIKADVYENWTDVSGILMADPKIVDNPSTIEQLTYDELQELAIMGASVLHEDSVKPVKLAGIALNIRNTNKPEDPGTMILGHVPEEKSLNKFITGLSGKKDYTILVAKRDNNDTSYPLRHSLKILDRYGIITEHVTLGQDSFAVVVPTEQIKDNLYNVMADMKAESDVADIQVQDKIAMIAAVGRRMTFNPGVSGKIFKAMGDNGVNIRTIKQGADELSIIFGVANEDFEKAIRVLYEEFAG